MRTKYFIILYLIANSACSQSNKEVVSYFNKRFPSLELSHVIFFEPELIEYCSDSLHKTEFKKELARQKRWIDTESVEGGNERIVFLHLLRQRIQQTKVSSIKLNENKEFLLNELSIFKVDFAVDENLLEKRFNPKKRGLPFGDEECDFDFSLYTFFLYDTPLYVKVLKENSDANPSKKLKFPLSCYLEERSRLPLVMKKRMQTELIKILDQYKGPDYDEIKKIISNADLNAKFD